MRCHLRAFIKALGISLGVTLVVPPACTDPGSGGSPPTTEASGADESSADGDSGETEVDDTGASVCRDWAAHECRRYEECSPPVIKVGYGTEEDCRTWLTETCEEHLRAESAGVTEAYYRDCTAASEAIATCSAWWNTWLAECREKRPGKRAIGDACVWNDQCQSLRCEKSAADSHCGTCAPVALEGESCDDEPVACAAGLLCLPEASVHASAGHGRGDDEYRCVRLAYFGERCGGEHPDCYGFTRCQDGTCQSYPGRGAPCDQGRCDVWLHCDPESDRCVDDKIAGKGDSCGRVDGHYYWCAFPLQCSSEGRCVQGLEVGETCEANPQDDSAPTCSGSKCVDGQCRRIHNDACGFTGPGAVRSY